MTFKELEQKEYPFSDSEFSGILDQLLEQKIIELPAPKRPEEVGKVDHPKYCKFHRIISHPVEKCFVLKDLIVRLDKENKIKLETRESPTADCSMVSFGSFDPTPIVKWENTFSHTYDADKSPAEEFGLQLPEGAISVKFEVDGEITINYIYPGMDGPPIPNRPTFYEIMTDDLDIWDSDSESEDEIGDGWTTFISKKEKYRVSNKTGKTSPFTSLAGLKLGALDMKVQPNEKVTLEESKGGWTLVEGRHRKTPRFPGFNICDKKLKTRNNQKRKSKSNSKVPTKSTGVEDVSCVHPKLPTLGDYFPKGFFNNECFTSHVINVEGKNEAK